MAQAKLAGLRARAKTATADAQIEFGKHAEQLEHGVVAAMAELRELGGAGEDAWEHLKEGAESAWGKLSPAVRNAADRLKSGFLTRPNPPTPLIRGGFCSLP